MAATASTMLGYTGRRKAPSPTTNILSLPSTAAAKSKINNKSNHNTVKKKTTSRPQTPRARQTLSTAPSPTLSSRIRSRNQIPNQRDPISIDGSDSELTPQSSDAEDDSMEIDQDLTPRKSKKYEPTPRSIDRKGKGKEKPQEPTKDTPSKKVTITGPAGRERKRNVKLEDAERRRARDAKFDLGNHATTSSSSLSKLREFDEASSFGDDESDHGQSSLVNPVPEDDSVGNLPEAFAGQDVEDLAYGAGFALENHTFGTFVTGGWSSSDDETEEEEEGIYIDHLSGSEDDRQSVSTGNGSDVDMSDSDDLSSSDEDDLDEFGFVRYPDASNLPMGPPDQPQLIVMENWRGELELVAPRPERPRRRERGSNPRNGGSAGTSTVVSGDQELRIDPDEDGSDSSSWSGLSDEDLDDGGDTTDSMEEDDMPVLDSPAMQQLIGEQIGQMDLESIPSPVEPLGPSIVVTDTSLPPPPATPALSTSASTPSLPAPAPVAPATPGSAAPQPTMPQMGIFHAMTSDPAQCAVIDGSKSATKSPFTHKKRTLRGRKNSVASSSRSSLPSLPASKRKPSMDLFSPSVQGTPKIDKLTKKARYSSIPGHPRFVKARRAEQAQACTSVASTTSESEAADADTLFSLEDMIEESVLLHESTDEDARHLIRFDTVPVAAYLRRNYLNSIGPSEGYRGAPSSSPMGRNGDDTLAGPLYGRNLLNSPILDAVQEDDEDRAASRKERRRNRKAGMKPLKI